MARLATCSGPSTPKHFVFKIVGLVGSRTPLRIDCSAHHLQEQKHLATKIRLMRMGKIRTPYYRIVVTDLNGKLIETIGNFHKNILGERSIQESGFDIEMMNFHLFHHGSCDQESH